MRQTPRKHRPGKAEREAKRAKLRRIADAPVRDPNLGGFLSVTGAKTIKRDRNAAGVVSRSAMVHAAKVVTANDRAALRAAIAKGDTKRVATIRKRLSNPSSVRGPRLRERPVLRLPKRYGAK